MSPTFSVPPAGTGAGMPSILPPGSPIDTALPSNVPSGGIDQERLDGIAQAVEAAVPALFTASYSGVALDEGHDRVLCYRVPSVALDDYILHKFTGQPIVMIDAKFSKVTLDAVTNRVTADRSYWAQRGATPSIWGSDPAVGLVDISIAEPVTPQLQQQFTARYAPVPIHLQRGQAIPI